MQRGCVPLQGCEDVSWQILRGADGTEATDEVLATAQSILQVAALCPCVHCAGTQRTALCIKAYAEHGSAAVCEPRRVCSTRSTHLDC